jgi:hypothetical protein
MTWLVKNVDLPSAHKMMTSEENLFVHNAGMMKAEPTGLELEASNGWEKKDWS